MRKIPFEEFDQTPCKGWRAFEAIGKFKEAGDAIVNYIKDNANPKSDISVPERSLLWFHAGQMYAFCEDNGMALKCLNNADEENGLIDILGPAAKAYLQATVAFLKRDRNSVGQKLNEILKIPLTDYSSGRLVFIPGRVHDMYEKPNAKYHDVYNLPFSLPPLLGEKEWFKITADELNTNSTKTREIAKRYNIDFTRPPRT